VHSGNEPLLIAGVGTETLEILEEQPALDAIVVPIGGGSGAAGACIVARRVRPGVRVIGVSRSGARALPLVARARLVEDEMEHVRRGLATRTAFELRSASSGSTSRSSCSSRTRRSVPLRRS
jgi:threonine dehydratase